MKNIILIAALLFALPAEAQTIGGNASLAAGTTQVEAALPASITTYPALLIEYAPPATTETFFKLGTTNAVAATLTSPTIPVNGICLNIGPNSFISVISTATQNIRITQFASCPVLP